MKNKLISIFIIFLLASGVSFASNESENETSKTLRAENEEITIKNESERIGENVTAREEGYLNISFEDDYNGYCINKGWKGAGEGDTFTVKNTSAAVNNNNHKEIGNYLKILFVDFHDEVTKNPKLAQNVIWSFSNDYLNHKYTDIYYKVIEIAKTGRIIEDHGHTISINDTAKAIFDFEVLSSGEAGYQNFFGYKITYEDIKEEIEDIVIPEVPKNSSPETPVVGAVENKTQKEENQVNNTTENSENLTELTNEETTVSKEDNPQKNDEKGRGMNNTNKTQSKNSKIGLSKHSTGLKAVVLLLAVIVVGSLIITKFRR